MNSAPPVRLIRTAVLAVPGCPQAGHSAQPEPQPTGRLPEEPWMAPQSAATGPERLLLEQEPVLLPGPARGPELEQVPRTELPLEHQA